MKKAMSKLFRCMLILSVFFIFAPSTTSNAATKLSKMSGKKIMKTLIANGFPIDDYTIYTTNRSDPNNLIGKPHQYKCKIDFFDKDYYADYSSYSCTVEIFKNSSDAAKRKKYIQSVYKKVPSWSERMYRYSNVLIRIDYAVPGKRAKYYKNAFKDMSKGKTPKYPVSINSKKLVLAQGQTSSLKLNVAASKAKWSTSNKSVAAISKSGKITAKKPGKATITAKYNGYSAKCTVTVTKKLTAQDLSSELLICTVDWGYEWDGISFRIYNRTSHDLKVSDCLFVYDDDYNLMGYMDLWCDNFEDEEIDDNIIPAGKTKTIDFYDWDGNDYIFYAQQLSFNVVLGGQTYTCIAEYTYNDSIPYTFTFR